MRSFPPKTHFSLGGQHTTKKKKRTFKVLKERLPSYLEPSAQITTKGAVERAEQASGGSISCKITMELKETSR